MGALQRTSPPVAAAAAPLVLITGASSGIGQALALRYHQAGWRLALVARRVDAIKQWASAHSISADSYQIYSADVADRDQIIAACEQCLAIQGVPDVVVANAGVSFGIDTAEREDLEVMAQTYATNVIGMAATFHAFVRPMQARGSGKLVGIASVAGIRGLPGHGAYCASKAAVISYCESLRVELARSGVQVQTICPGFVATPLTSQNRYGMPFLMQPEAFADRAFAAIGKGRSYSVIPWQMGLVAKLLRLLPNAVYDRALANRPRKHRHAERTGGSEG
ncbi:SDR family oxidoreductase [Comamonas sp. 4034]|uniref:SDR family oxidoreductase n=1 Tax=Comamonas sp. 4034 TaxID=3156455 RepID=UPI003D24E385